MEEINVLSSKGNAGSENRLDWVEERENTKNSVKKNKSSVKTLNKFCHLRTEK